MDRMLNFQIDPNSGIPIYVQLMDQVKLAIATGALQAGQQLPTIRELAVELTVNLHTISHAYSELERDGFLTVQRGRGTFVTERKPDKELDDLWEKKLTTLVETMLAEALNLGYEPDEVSRAVAAAIAQRRETMRQAAEEAAHRDAAQQGVGSDARLEKSRPVHGRRAVAEAVL